MFDKPSLTTLYKKFCKVTKCFQETGIFRSIYVPPTTKKIQVCTVNKNTCKVTKTFFKKLGRL